MIILHLNTGQGHLKGVSQRLMLYQGHMNAGQGYLYGPMLYQGHLDTNQGYASQTRVTTQAL